MPSWEAISQEILLVRDLLTASENEPPVWDLSDSATSLLVSLYAHLRRDANVQQVMDQLARENALDKIGGVRIEGLPMEPVGPDSKPVVFIEPTMATREQLARSGRGEGHRHPAAARPRKPRNHPGLLRRIAPLDRIAAVRSVSF